jgi:hypothetical protein
MWYDTNVSEVLAASIFTHHPEDGGSKTLRNVGIIPHPYTTPKH